MKKIIFISAMTAMILVGCAENLTIEERKGTVMVHDVFFTLNDNSDAAVQKLIGDCYKYLKDHDGVVFFAAGPRAAEYQRPVNDSEFDVALTVVFKDKSYHVKYQTAEDHLKFIAENKPNWKQVRVFDSLVAK